MINFSKILIKNKPLWAAISTSNIPWIPEGASNYDEYGDVARSAKSTYEEEFNDSEGGRLLGCVEPSLLELFRSMVPAGDRSFGTEVPLTTGGTCTHVVVDERPVTWVQNRGRSRIIHENLIPWIVEAFPGKPRKCKTFLRGEALNPLLRTGA